MNAPPKHIPPKPARTRELAPAARAQRPDSMRSTVLLSLIVCPHGGVRHTRHGQGAAFRAS